MEKSTLLVFKKYTYATVVQDLGESIQFKKTSRTNNVKLVQCSGN